MAKRWKIRDISCFTLHVSETSSSGKGFIFDHRSGYVYLANRTGVHILQGLREGRSTGQIADSLSARFGLDREVALNDTQEFLENLQSEGLASVED